jgi:pimeloyl-ACP methyl ester carboxylesterase
MEFAFENPEKVNKLIVVDISTRAYDSESQRNIVSALNSVSLEGIQSRNEVMALLSEKIPDPTTVQFLLKNLGREEQGLSWKMNLPALTVNYNKIVGGIDESRQFEGDTLFIAGERSNYITVEDHDKLRKMFPRAIFVKVKDAGHWVHADTPDAFFQTVIQFLEPGI